MFYKSLFSSAYLWSRARLATNKKTEMFIVTRSPTCWKYDSWFWFLWKDKQRIKVNLQLLFVVIIVTIISQIRCKAFVTQCFFTDHVKHKTVMKITFKTPSTNPHQLRTSTLIEELSNWSVYFLRLSGFTDLFVQSILGYF